MIVDRAVNGVRILCGAVRFGAMLCTWRAVAK